MSRVDLNILQRIALEFIWVNCWIVGHLPHFVQYRVLAPALNFLLCRVLRYRKKVVDKNLELSFPQRSAEERKSIRNGFYVILSEVIVSTMALSNKRSYGVMFQGDAPRVEGDMSQLREEYNGKSWVALTAHFGLWEYMMFWSTFSNQRLLAVYHLLGNKIFEALLRRLRNHHKVETIPSKEVLRFVLRHGDTYQGESYLLGLIADQSPRNRPQSCWHKFLGQDTIFYDGGEKIAVKLGLPTRFIYQIRTAPGRYEMRYTPIWDGVEPIDPNEMTARYVALLESAIEKCPEMWLWSHRRWKAKKSVNTENN